MRPRAGDPGPAEPLCYPCGLRVSFAPARLAPWAVEQAVLRRIRSDMGLSHFLTADQLGAQGGWTETFDAKLIHPSHLCQIVEQSNPIFSSYLGAWWGLWTASLPFRGNAVDRGH